MSSGFDGEEVSDRNLAKSIGCSKNFRGPDCLDTKEKVRSQNTYMVAHKRPVGESINNIKIIL